MAFVGWSALYILVHLGVYVVALRHLAAFAQERVIFLYHAVSAVLLSAAALASLLVPGSGADLYAVVAVVALHGVYSVSFLEVWSLAEGGYSLQILQHVGYAEQRGVPLDLSALQAIGMAKQASRLNGLARLGLVREAGGRIQLTGAGHLVASFLALIAWLSFVQDGV